MPDNRMINTFKSFPEARKKYLDALKLSIGNYSIGT